MINLENAKLEKPILKHYAKVTYMVDYIIDRDEETKIFEVPSSDIKEIEFGRHRFSGSDIIEVELFDKIVATCKVDDKVYSLASEPTNNKCYLVGELLTVDEAIEKYPGCGSLVASVSDHRDSLLGVGVNTWDYSLITKDNENYVVNPNELKYKDKEQ